MLTVASAAFAATSLPAIRQQPEVLTNLSQLRGWAENELTNVHPFRIVADVCEADPAAGVLVLRDATDLEFIHVDFKNQDIKPGDTVSFKGEGSAFRLQGFGLAVVPRLILDIDGVHGIKVESSSVFLHKGLNPVTAQWFNHLGHASLVVDYVGPGVPRQPLPSTLLFRAVFNPATGATNFIQGLDYRCFEDTYEHLPNFAVSPPTKTGVATNFDVGLRSRPENAAMEFDGFLTVPREGMYTFTVSSDDGSRFFVGQPFIQIDVLSNHPAPAEIRRVPTEVDERRNPDLWVTLEGTVNFSGIRGAGGEMQLRVGKDDIRVDVFESGKSQPYFPPRSKVRVAGIYRDIITDDGGRIPGVLRVLSWNYIHLLSPADTKPDETIRTGEMISSAVNRPSETTAINVISTVAEIKALRPDLANKRLPVSIRGVITATVQGGAVIQDATRGIYVFLPSNAETWPFQRGEFCQIEGVTSPGLFAPSISAQKITHLGSGQFPQPLQATWDQLVNGTLDTEYAELEGVIANTHDQRVELLAKGGKVSLYLDDFRPDVLAGYKNSLVRIRGCVFARFNEATHKMEPGSLRMNGAAIQILETAPPDVFATPQKSIAELLFYDPKAAPFRRLKISGQVIYGRPGSYYLTDGTNGIHVTTRSRDSFQAGDLVDAVGFLELGGPASELKEAVMRKTGLASLPSPTLLTSTNLLLASLGGTLVRVDATLMNQWIDGAEHVLELQSGFLAFRGRIHGYDKVRLPASGSRLQLTGVYAAQGNRQSDGKVNGFELLLHSPLDVRVLSTPPWWNLKRVLILAGVLGVLLFGTLIWNKELQWKVQERTRQLEAEIRHRQKAEVQRAAEAERARIARDLHDELGAGLTEVTLLASTGFGDFRSQKSGDDRFGTIAEKARALVSRLDVIVWAIDPTRNSLQSFADYISGYAKEFLAASNVICRLKIPIECRGITLVGTARHNLFLAVKESLNNVIRHAGASEVELQLVQLDHHLEIAIIDNGRGFDRATMARGHGLANLEQRLKALHGECRIESRPGSGTKIKLIFPLPSESE